MMWKTVKLGEVLKTGAGGTPLKSQSGYYEGGTIKWLLSGAVCEKDIHDSKTHITEDGLANSSAKLFPRNTVLVAMYGATAGQVGILRTEAATNQAVCGIYPSEDYLPEFLYYYLTNYKETLLLEVSGVAQPNLSQVKIKNIPVPLISLAEQQRIVAKLNAAFAEIDEAMNAAEAKETEVQKLKTSLLSSSLNGDAVMWNTVKLGDMLEVQNGYAFNSKQFDVDGDMPLIRIRDLKNAFKTETCYTGEYDDKYIVQSGDLLIGMDGEFRCYEWQGGAALLNQRVCKLQNFHADLDQRFLLYAINSELKKIEDVTGFTTVKHLSSNTIKQIELSIPSLAEQQRIVAKLDAADSEFRNVNESIAKSKANLLALKSAILIQELKLEKAA